MNHRTATDSLVRFGFSPSFVHTFEPYAELGLIPARVTIERRGSYVVVGSDGELLAELAGKLRHATTSRADLPAVGDWVAIRVANAGDSAVIHAVLPRQTAFVRGVAGGTTEAQVVAANVDVVLLVCALDGDFSLRRLERYLSLAHASGAAPVIVLTKSDLEGDLDARLAEVSSIASGAPVHAVSCLSRGGGSVEALRVYFEGDRTIAILGSSGAGKSTLVNRLLGEDVQLVGATLSDGRGKHTTTERQLMLVPGGGLVLDTPGMRELRLWDDGDAREGLADAFADIAALASACHFRDCTHHGEPGCAVEAALDDGALDADRWASFAKLERELSSLAARQDARLGAERKKAMKVIARARRAMPNKL